MEHECIIGMYNNYENTCLYTFAELIEKSSDDWDLWLEGHDWLHPPTTMVDFFDKRINTELTRFNYCPECGKKIDWNELKRKCKEM